MATQSEIQQLLDEAQRCYYSGDKTGAAWIWRTKLKDAIGEYDGMSDDGDRARLGHHIHAMLDGMGLQVVPLPINLAAEEATVRQNPQAGLKPKEKISWLFF